MHVCGPQGECGCECPDGPCGHVWGDEPKDMGGGAWSVICFKCDVGDESFVMGAAIKQEFEGAQ